MATHKAADVVGGPADPRPERRAVLWVFSRGEDSPYGRVTSAANPFGATFCLMKPWAAQS